jgi:hypothetical protein
VRVWKLCGLYNDFYEGLEALWFTKSWLSLRGSGNAARLFGATWSSKIPCSSPTSRDVHCWQIWQKQSFEEAVSIGDLDVRGTWNSQLRF